MTDPHGFSHGGKVSRHIQDILIPLSGLFKPCWFPNTKAASLILRQYTDLYGQYMYSTGKFHNCPEHYLHHSHQVFNSGLEIDMLQEYIFIALDSFHNLVSEPTNELEAWLAFISTRTLEEMDRVILKFPSFQTIRNDVIMYGETRPEEVLRMYLDCLDLFDYNDRLQDLKETKEELEQVKKEVVEKDSALAQALSEITKLQEQLTSK